MPMLDQDIHPRSHPDDRQEGNFNPDPNLECWTCGPDGAEPSGSAPAFPIKAVLAVHGPSGEAGDDDGAGNPSPRPEESGYGQADADQGHLGPD